MSYLGNEECGDAMSAAAAALEVHARETAAAMAHNALVGDDASSEGGIFRHRQRKAHNDMVYGAHEMALAASKGAETSSEEAAVAAAAAAAAQNNNIDAAQCGSEGAIGAAQCDTNDAQVSLKDWIHLCCVEAKSGNVCGAFSALVSALAKHNIASAQSAFFVGNLPSATSQAPAEAAFELKETPAAAAAAAAGDDFSLFAPEAPKTPATSRERSAVSAPQRTEDAATASQTGKEAPELNGQALPVSQQNASAAFDDITVALAEEPRAASLPAASEAAATTEKAPGSSQVTHEGSVVSVAHVSDEVLAQRVVEAQRQAKKALRRDTKLLEIVCQYEELVKQAKKKLEEAKQCHSTENVAKVTRSFREVERSFRKLAEEAQRKSHRASRNEQHAFGSVMTYGAALIQKIGHRLDEIAGEIALAPPQPPQQQDQQPASSPVASEASSQAAGSPAGSPLRTPVSSPTGSQSDDESEDDDVEILRVITTTTVTKKKKKSAAAKRKKKRAAAAAAPKKKRHRNGCDEKKRKRANEEHEEPEAAAKRRKSEASEPTEEGGKTEAESEAGNAEGSEAESGPPLSDEEREAAARQHFESALAQDRCGTKQLREAAIAVLRLVFPRAGRLRFGDKVLEVLRWPAAAEPYVKACDSVLRRVANVTTARQRQPLKTILTLSKNGVQNEELDKFCSGSAKFWQEASRGALALRK